MSEKQWSQVQAINGPAPNSWDDYENGCLLTFSGGYEDPSNHTVFQHGMRTVFNLLRDEFPPAQSCKAATTMLHALEMARDYLEDGSETDGETYEAVVAAIASATPADPAAE